MNLHIKQTNVKSKLWKREMNKNEKRREVQQQRMRNERMIRQNNRTKRITMILIVIVLTIVLLGLNTVISKVKAQVVQPTPDQKVEYRAVECEEKNGSKQLVIEVWIKKLNFKVIDLKLEYDPNLLITSDLGSNQIVDINEQDDMPTYFEFSNEFGNYLELFGMSSTAGEFRTVLSMLGEEDRTGTNSYLIEDNEIGDYVSVPEQLLLGRISFQVVGDEAITDKAFQLKEGNSPKTGIKVNINGVDSYEAKSLFQFTLNLASDNAYLINIEMDKATIENFDKTIFNYIVSLDEDTDILELMPTKEDEKATITIGGEEVESGEPYSIELNPIGEETKIDILVTAEDGVTQNTYTVLVQRTRRNNKRFNYNQLFKRRRKWNNTYSRYKNI